MPPPQITSCSMLLLAMLQWATANPCDHWILKFFKESYVASGQNKICLEQACPQSCAVVKYILENPKNPMPGICADIEGFACLVDATNAASCGQLSTIPVFAAISLTTQAEAQQQCRNNMPDMTFSQHRRLEAWPSGLVRLYKCDDASGNYVHDYSGSNVVASMGGGMESSPNAWQEQAIHGITRPVLYFDRNGYVAGPASGLPGGSLPRTIMAWVKPLRGSGNGPFGYGTSGCNNAYYTWISGGKDLNLDQWCQDEGVNNPVLGDYEERWYHLAFSYDGQFNAAYVDGTLKARGEPDTQPSTKVGSDARAAMGGNPRPSGDYRGWIADFAIFDRALTANEITKIYVDGPTVTTSTTTTTTTTPVSSPSPSTTRDMPFPEGTTTGRPRSCSKIPRELARKLNAPVCPQSTP